MIATRIPVKVYYDKHEDRIKMYGSKRELVKTLYCTFCLVYFIKVRG